MTAALPVEIVRVRPGAAALDSAALHESPAPRAWICWPTSRARSSLAPGERALVPTGIAIALPPGYEAQVRPRSGLALRHGVTLLNAPGTIDADYRGEIQVLLVNLGQAPATVRRGERIAQLVVAPVDADRLARGRGAARQLARRRRLREHGRRRGGARAMIERYTRPEMARLWTDEARLRAGSRSSWPWSTRSPRAARCRRRPRSVLRARARVDVERMQAIEAEVKHDVIAFVSSVAGAVGRRGPLPAPRPHLVATWSTPPSRCSCATPPTCCSRASTGSARPSARRPSATGTRR